MKLSITTITAFLAAAAMALPAHDASSLAPRVSLATVEEAAGQLEKRATPCPIREEEKLKYAANLQRDMNNDCGAGCQDSIGSFQTKQAQCRVAADCPTINDMRSYQANYVKKKQNTCDSGCVSSLAAYTQLVAKCAQPPK
ncbi:hypothetical protein P8C59_005954 [Phyllachora maydis]|uniref:Uncharacterized protein n=1 Tax=Phyllachora maydis TaxID=1825666 RepID=A0AAD9I5D1_9PEZI|nr:hypothetical protein P8C59_005954 [Phyllachora maydis]